MFQSIFGFFGRQKSGFSIMTKRLSPKKGSDSASSRARSNNVPSILNMPTFKSLSASSTTVRSNSCFASSIKNLLCPKINRPAEADLFYFGHLRCIIHVWTTIHHFYFLFSKMVRHSVSSDPYKKWIAPCRSVRNIGIFRNSRRSSICASGCPYRFCFPADIKANSGWT